MMHKSTSSSKMIIKIAHLRHKVPMVEQEHPLIIKNYEEMFKQFLQLIKKMIGYLT